MQRLKKRLKKSALIFLALGVISLLTCATVPRGTPAAFIVVNPYENVDWDAFGRYRAALHLHTTRSDGAATVAETILDLYNKGFDIVAITDHSDVAPTFAGDWAAGADSLTASQRDAIIAGTFGRTEYTGFAFPGDFGPAFHRPAGQGGMIPLPFSNEQSRAEHIVTLWADFIDGPGWSQANVLQATADAGGVAFLAHPGRYTTGAAGGGGGIASSNNPTRISHYIEMFDRFPVALGFELFNRNDNETRSDRVLWDNVLRELMPYGRFVWGFANDDSHSMNQAGFNWNVLLMPRLSSDNARTAMESGAFYMVSRVNRGVGAADPAVNAFLPGGGNMPNGGNPDTVFMLRQTTPSISRIVTSDTAITISGENFDRIEWVADGVVIHVGPTLNLRANWQRINNNHVRAQLVSDYGIALTQPFAVLPAGTSFQARPGGNNIVSVDTPQEVRMLSFGELEHRLPGNAVAVTERGWRSVAPVTWSLENLTYNPSGAAVQTFTVPGAITLPSGVTNENDAPLEVSVQVTVGVDPRISIAEANAMPVGTIITIEGYVTAMRTGDSHRINIQDSNEPWSAFFIQDNAGRYPDSPTGSRLGLQVGQWVRITGTRSVQWFNNAIIFNSATGDGGWEVVSSEDRPVIQPVEIDLEELQLGVQGQWNNMLVSLRTPLIQRDAAIDLTVPPMGTGMPNHILRIPGEGRVDVQYVLPGNFSNGDSVRIERAIVHWRNDLESHRLHPDWANGLVTIAAE